MSALNFNRRVPEQLIIGETTVRLIEIDWRAVRLLFVAHTSIRICRSELVDDGFDLSRVHSFGGTGSLILKRRENQSVRIGQDVTLTVRHIGKAQCELRVEAPPEVLILRGEVLDRRKAGVGHA